MIHQRLRRAWVLLLTGLAVLGATIFATASLASAAPAPPTPGDCPSVRVDSVELVRTTSGPGLLVKGVKAHADTRVHLVAEDVDFIQPPDYWTYFVLGCGGTGPVVKTPFTQTFGLDGPRGKCGIAIPPFFIDVGANPEICPPTI